MDFDVIYSWALFSITFASVLMQVYVIWVVLTKSPQAMHEYRYFLCLYTLCDLAFTFVFGFVVHPDPLFPSKAASINGLAKLLGQGSAGLSMALVSALGAVVVAAQDYCLVYRMTVVLEDQRYHTLLVSKWIYGAAIAGGAVLAVVVGLPFYHSTSHDPDYIIPNILKYEAARPLLKDDMVIIYLRTDMTWAVLMMLTVVSGVVVAALVGFGAVYAILRTLRKNAISFSSRTYRLHVQLTLLLLAQLSSPSVFVMFPMMVAIFSMIYHFELSQSNGRIGFLLFSLYAPVNSFLVILFVTPYRRFTAACLRRVFPQWLGNLLGKKNQVSPPVDQNASSSTAMRVLRRGGIMSRIMYEAT